MSYNPMNNLGVNAFMRWPVLSLPIASLIGLFSDSLIGAILAWIASVALGTYAATKIFKDELCDCEGEAKKKGWSTQLPKINWIIQKDQNSGSKRPWELYSIYGDDESTKQHYASYSTEQHALDKKAILEKMMAKEE